MPQGSVKMERCEFCFNYFNPPARADQAAKRKHWFCNDSCRSQFNQGYVRCQCCNKNRMKHNQIVCNKCHKKKK